MKKAQIIIYAILNHFDKAVKIALECQDVEMAKQYANKPEDKKLKKKLWMKIAKYLFNYQGKKKNKQQSAQGSLVGGSGAAGANAPGRPAKYRISEALQILQDSKLKIDDLLPLFPPDEKVQDMKEHLCECLNDYHNKIHSLKKELEDHSTNAELLRKQQRKQKHKHITINPSQMCDLCFKPIFDREFYVFPCQHAFHRMCIQNKLANYQTKDVEVKVMLDKLKSCFGQIDSIRDQAQLIAQQSNQSNAGPAGGGGGNFEQDRGQSYLNDITSIASNVLAKGANFINAGNTSLNLGGAGRNQQASAGLN